MPADAPAPAPTERSGGALPWSWRIGTLAGIGIYVHATFFLLVAWFVIAGLASGQGLAASLASLVLLGAVFGTVVLHELGHALTARRFGVRTRDITLLPIGGVARLERIPERPREELLIALAGPAVNVALAGLFAVAGAATGAVFFIQLAWINAAIAGFNLLPAFPMDGGRVLRALLASRLGWTRGTVLAGRVGKLMAVLLGVAGLWLSPVLVLIAVFVWLGAHREGRLASVRAAIGSTPVARAMITDFVTLDPDQPLAEAAQRIVAGSQQDFPVVEGGALRGLLTREDVIAGLARSGPTTLIRAAMHHDVGRAGIGEPLGEAFGRMQGADPAVLVVVEDDRPIGLLTLENVGEYLALRGALAGQA
jgi:Zn-dependent protease